jgi:hypothetical protein
MLRAIWSKWDTVVCELLIAQTWYAVVNRGSAGVGLDSCMAVSSKDFLMRIPPKDWIECTFKSSQSSHSHR